MITVPGIGIPAGINQVPLAYAPELNSVHKSTGWFKLTVIELSDPVLFTSAIVRSDLTNTKSTIN